MTFIKGHTHSKETRIKIGLSNSKSLLGHKQSEITIKKRSTSLIGHKVSEQTKEKISNKQKGTKLKDENPNWRGDKTSYHNKHMWIYRHFGKANKCERCKSKRKKRYEWANISGKYKRNMSDWSQLCTSCHRKYDLGLISLAETFNKLTNKNNE